MTIHVFGLAVSDVSKKPIAFIFTEHVKSSTIDKESKTFLLNALNEASNEAYNETSNEALPQNRVPDMFYTGLQEKEESSFIA